MTDVSWVEKAACRGKPIEIFFVERGQSTREAKEICASCAVKTECLEDALSNKYDTDMFGIFGGLSPRERRKVRQKRAKEQA
jgi:WhiB family redox-sensing transcriptional regulator